MRHSEYIGKSTNPQRQCSDNKCDTNVSKICILFLLTICNVRGVFQKYADRFHRMFAIAAR